MSPSVPYGKKAYKKATGCDEVKDCGYDYTVLRPEFWED
jgi:hypothetical protein